MTGEGWEEEVTKGNKLTSVVHYLDCGNDFIDGTFVVET